MCLNKRLKPRRIAGDLICHDGSDGTIPKHRQDDVATHSSLGLVNTSAMITTGNPSWRHCFSHVCTRQLQIEVVNVNNESPMRSIGVFFRSFRQKSATLKKLCGPFLTLFHVLRCFTTKFNSNPIHRAHKVRRKPLVLTTHTYPHSNDLYCSPAFMGVYHNSHLSPQQWP